MTRLLKVNKTGLYLIAAGFVLVAITLILPSCAKDPGKIGTILQPGSSFLKVRYTDTTSVVAYSVMDDSVRTDELTRNAIGFVNDPVFGATKASFYTQFVLSTNGHNFGTNPQLDSLVLQLVYSGAYADTNTTLTIHTYQIDNQENNFMYLDSAYYNRKTFLVGETDFSNYSFQPRPHDSVHFDRDTLPPLIRINLSKYSTQLGEYLLAADSTDNMEDDDSFHKYFRGLYLTPSDVASEGALAYFNLISSGSASGTRLTLYYSTTVNGSIRDSLQYDYYISTSAARVGHYEHMHDNVSPDFRSQVIDGDTSLGNQKFYIQGFAGVKTIIKVPNPKSWTNLVNVAVNEAKLILPGGDNPKFYGAPSQLVLVQRLEDGSYELLPDYNTGLSYFGGSYISSSNQYEFRITRYIQSIISDSTIVDYGLYLLVNAGSVNPESFIFNGIQTTADSSARMKLEILYTDLD
ncbi:MAG: DUF4270 domain-containing protein [Bacteroidales bacterium]|jgi:hypothetical protein